MTDYAYRFECSACGQVMKTNGPWFTGPARPKAACPACGASYQHPLPPGIHVEVVSAERKPSAGAPAAVDTTVNLGPILIGLAVVAGITVVAVVLVVAHRSADQTRAAAQHVNDPAALARAIREGDFATAEQCLKRGQSINDCLDPASQCPPLVVACEAGSRERVVFCLNHGADPNLRNGTFGVTPLYAAAGNGNVGIVQELLTRGADPNQRASTGGCPPLFPAITQGNATIVELLLQRHADPNARSTTGNTPLFTAIGAKNVTACELLLKYKADPTRKSEHFEDSPVCFAMRQCPPAPAALLRALLKGGAPLDRSATALRWAIARPEYLDVYVENGFDVRAPLADGGSLLHVASANMQPSLAVFESLCQRGVDPAAVDKLGRTVLHCAAANPRTTPEILAFLASHGCDANAVDHDGKSALDCCVGGAPNLRQLLDCSAKLDLTTPRGRKLLRDICTRDDEESANVLLGADRGADLNVSNRVETMCWAVRCQGHGGRVVRALLTHGWDPNLKGTDGAAPIHLAARLRQTHTVTLMLEHGGDLDLRDDNGRTVDEVYDAAQATLREAYPSHAKFQTMWTLSNGAVLRGTMVRFEGEFITLRHPTAPTNLVVSVNLIVLRDQHPGGETLSNFCLVNPRYRKLAQQVKNEDYRPWQYRDFAPAVEAAYLCRAKTNSTCHVMCRRNGTIFQVREDDLADGSALAAMADLAPKL